MFCQHFAVSSVFRCYLGIVYNEIKENLLCPSWSSPPNGAENLLSILSGLRAPRLYVPAPPTIIEGRGIYFLLCHRISIKNNSRINNSEAPSSDLHRMIFYSLSFWLLLEVYLAVLLIHFETQQTYAFADLLKTFPALLCNAFGDSLAQNIWSTTSILFPFPKTATDYLTGHSIPISSCLHGFIN